MKSAQPGRQRKSRWEILHLRGWLVYGDLLMPLWRAGARRRRRLYCGKYAVVTGSCGKSTTTSLIGRLAALQVRAASGQFDNMERHALRLLRRLKAPVDIVVQEVTESPLGTLRAVARTLRPDLAVVTAIGLDHASKFGNRDAVRAEIATLTGALGPDSVLCLNADDAQVLRLAGATPARVVLFGTGPAAQLRAENIRSQWPGRLCFDLRRGDRCIPVATRFVGQIMLTNILGALAAIEALGLDLERAIADLAGLEPLVNRMSLTETPGGHVLLSDTRKAPFWSTQLAIGDLPNMSAGRRIVVLGEMSDTKSEQNRKYRQTLRAAAEKCDLVIGFGHSAPQARKLKSIEPHLHIVAADTGAQLHDILSREPPSFIYVKANRPDLAGFDGGALAAAGPPVS